jgi:hypothetical protein
MDVGDISGVGGTLVGNGATVAVRVRVALWP